MPHSLKPLDSWHSIDSCAFELQNWRPFHLDSSDSTKPSYSPSNGVHTKRPCLSDRATSFSAIDAAAIDVSKLSLVDNDYVSSKPISAPTAPHSQVGYSLIDRKRRRRGSRSVSGRSSDRSGTRCCCSVGASAGAYGTCSDFPVAMGTDSSGELFGNGEASWASDVSEAKNSRREKDNGNGSGEKENSGVVFVQLGCLDAQGNESGYGSEPVYRGDAEFGYGDEFDEEEEEAKFLFWGNHFGGTN